jgi:hypothetical protein
MARGREAPPALEALRAPARARAQRVVVSWNFELDLLRRVRPEFLKPGVSAARLEIEIEEGARSSARLVATGTGAGNSAGSIVLAAATIAESLRAARSSRDLSLGLDHLDVPGFAAITWRTAPGGPRLLYARSSLIKELGITGGRLDGAVGSWG